MARGLMARGRLALGRMARGPWASGTLGCALGPLDLGTLGPCDLGVKSSHIYSENAVLNFAKLKT